MAARHKRVRARSERINIPSRELIFHPSNVDVSTRKIRKADEDTLAVFANEIARVLQKLDFTSRVHVRTQEGKSCRRR